MTAWFGVDQLTLGRNSNDYKFSFGAINLLYALLFCHLNIRTDDVFCRVDRNGSQISQIVRFLPGDLNLRLSLIKYAVV